MSAMVANRMTDAEITYRSANNPYIDERIADVRAAYGVQNFAPKGAGTRELVRALSRGKTIALMNDQKFNQGIAAPFFGHDAMTAPGPTRLARKFGATLLPCSTLRTGPARYRVTVYEPIEIPDGDEEAAIRDTVVKINQFVEARVREAPEQWFWMHNRWPKEAWVKAGVM
jgi:KDO2-lipid IV(A) lauroyltransferase